MKLVFANVLQFFVFAGKSLDDQVFSRFSPQEYVAYFATKKPDILVVTELLIDGADGSSTYAQQLSSELHLPYFNVFIDAESWIYKGKQYGQAIFSRYPITYAEQFALPHPPLAVDRPDGSRWVMHDKNAHKFTLDIEGKEVVMYTLHYFPLFLFGKSLMDPVFTPDRTTLENKLLEETTKPVIIAGDFNNTGVSLPQAFPRLFANNKYMEAVPAETTIVGGADQVDHVLYSDASFTCTQSKAEQYLSDHYSLEAELNLK